MSFFNLRQMTLLLTLQLFLTACSGDPAKTAIELILQGNPKISASDVSLADCELRIASTGKNAVSQTSVESLLRADLRLFDLRKVRITALEDGRAALTLQRSPVSEPMLDQAMRIFQSMAQNVRSNGGRLTRVPSDGSKPIVENRLETENIAGTSRQTARKLLATPGAQLNLRFTSVMVNGVPQTPPEEGAAFYEFAKRVEAIPTPQTASIALLFQSENSGPDTFTSGTVALPSSLTFATSSVDKAKQLTNVLHEYRKTCNRV